MALTLGAATSDRVPIGSNASIKNLAASAFTICAWVKASALTSGRTIFASMGDGGNTSVIQFRLSGTTGIIELRISRATTTADYLTSGNIVVIGSWVFVAATFDSSLGTNLCKIYSASFTSAPALLALGTNTDGSGAVTAESSQFAQWGNRWSASTNTSAFQGDMAFCQLYNRALTLAEINQIWAKRIMLKGCVNYLELGFNGVGTQTDYSGNGNSGTVTGATLSTLGFPGPKPFNNAFTPRALRKTTITSTGAPPAFSSTKKKFYYYHRTRR